MDFGYVTKSSVFLFNNVVPFLLYPAYDFNGNGGGRLHYLLSSRKQILLRDRRCVLWKLDHVM
jgi:hypothetical protein